MSGISSVSGYGTNSYQWLQQIAARFSEQVGETTSASTASTASTDSTNSIDSTDSTSSSSTSAADTTTSTDSLKNQIESAIISALENAEQSGDSTNFQTVVKNAVESTLKANGIDPDQLQQSM